MTHNNVQKITSPHFLGILFALITALLFSSKAIFIKQAYALSPQIDATVLMTLRMLCALPFFLLIAWYSRQQRQATRLQDWLLLAFAGVLGYYFASWLDFIGLMFISASLERIILFLYPTLTVLGSAIFFKHKVDLTTLCAIALSYGGTVLVMWQEHHQMQDHSQLWLGGGLVFASALCFAAYLMLSKPLITRFGSWHFTGLTLSVACMAMLLHFFIATTAPLQRLQALPNSAWAYGMCLGILVTVIPTVLLAHSIARLGPARSAMIGSIGPILTILLAVLFLDEQLNTIQWLGCGLNILGIIFISLAKPKTKAI